MSKSKKTSNGAMLELWRPPQGAGDPIGCLATTYTFAPGLFDEQCLARFLEIESEPNREDLAFLLERESRLGAVYAGVLVDHTQAGVEHSLRWDVLPVRIHLGKQHAKLSLLAWNRHVRVIVTSANLTESGYRINHEVAAAVDLIPGQQQRFGRAEPWPPFGLVPEHRHTEVEVPSHSSGHELAQRGSDQARNAALGSLAARIFVCSEVMGEGVDLQRFCRHVIHHDLAWNPSSIEQRTGRIDRLGCKAEGRAPILVYLPYLAGTADERQYRVMS